MNKYQLIKFNKKKFIFFKAFEEQKKKWQKNVNNKRGVLYIGKLPFGFYEEALTKFFEQFGEITRLKVARSQKVS